MKRTITQRVARHVVSYPGLCLELEPVALVVHSPGGRGAKSPRMRRKEITKGLFPSSTCGRAPGQDAREYVCHGAAACTQVLAQGREWSFHSFAQTLDSHVVPLTNGRPSDPSESERSSLFSQPCQSRTRGEAPKVQRTRGRELLFASFPRCAALTAPLAFIDRLPAQATCQKQAASAPSSRRDKFHASQIGSGREDLVSIFGDSSPAVPVVEDRVRTIAELSRNEHRRPQVCMSSLQPSTPILAFWHFDVKLLSTPDHACGVVSIRVFRRRSRHFRTRIHTQPCGCLPSHHPGHSVAKRHLGQPPSC
jgi:hypothetical protein